MTIIQPSTSTIEYPNNRGAVLDYDVTPIIGESGDWYTPSGACPPNCAYRGVNKNNTTLTIFNSRGKCYIWGHRIGGTRKAFKCLEHLARIFRDPGKGIGTSDPLWWTIFNPAEDEGLPRTQTWSHRLSSKRTRMRNKIGHAEGVVIHRSDGRLSLLLSTADLSLTDLRGWRAEDRQAFDMARGWLSLPGVRQVNFTRGAWAMPRPESNSTRLIPGYEAGELVAAELERLTGVRINETTIGWVRPTEISELEWNRLVEVAADSVRKSLAKERHVIPGSNTV